MLSAPEIVALQRQLTEYRFEQWGQESLLAPQWWCLIFLLIIPWPIWCKLVDRKRILEISMFGALTIGLITVMDALGLELGLWGYKYKIIPLLPGLLPLDLSVLPVMHMLIYQYFRPWKSFLIALLITGCGLAFVGEPLMVRMGIYQIYHWQYIYSLPIYIAKAVACRLILTNLMNMRTR